MVSREIKKFWAKIGQLVKYKHQQLLEKHEKEVMPGVGALRLRFCWRENVSKDVKNDRIEVATNQSDNREINP